MIPFVDLKTQTANLRSELQIAIDDSLSRCDYILGEAVTRFELAFAKMIGVEHAVGVGNGIDALRLVLDGLEIGSGDEVILPANTFIATALAVSAVGARPVLVDCDERTYNIDPTKIEAAITAKTRAIMPVHLTGQPVDMDAVGAIAKRRNLAVVEDACQAHGAVYRGKMCGNLGVAGCFSFYPGKNLGAFGDGGLVTTSDAKLAERMRRLRNYGQSVKYHHVEKGLNTRLDTLQAALLEVKLRHLPQWNVARRAHAAKYLEALVGVGDLRFPQCIAEVEHVYHLFIIETDRRDALKDFLEQRKIQVGIHYPIPIHLQEAYRELGYGKGAFPAAERLAGRILSLPMFPELQADQSATVIAAVREFFR
jgi:dTDP-4-amino-4,6-dideoxygalactose transaminase